jgi:DNA-directed RNA polymerase specialized sigma24 family protein
MALPARESPIDDDNDLLVAVANSDPRALEALYLRYNHRLARFVARVTPRYENIEEIINDTFMVVWKSAANFRKASHVSTWIFAIAYRTALNSLRRLKKTARVSAGARRWACAAMRRSEDHLLESIACGDSRRNERGVGIGATVLVR